VAGGHTAKVVQCDQPGFERVHRVQVDVAYHITSVEFNRRVSFAESAVVRARRTFSDGEVREVREASRSLQEIMKSWYSHPEPCAPSRGNVPLLTDQRY